MTVAVDESTTIIGPREPLAGWDAIEKVMESPSVSEPLRVSSTGVSSDVEPLVSFAVGGVGLKNEIFGHTSICGAYPLPFPEGPRRSPAST